MTVRSAALSMRASWIVSEVKVFTANGTLCSLSDRFWAIKITSSSIIGPGPARMLLICLFHSDIPANYLFSRAAVVRSRSSEGIIFGQTFQSRLRTSVYASYISLHTVLRSWGAVRRIRDSVRRFPPVSRRHQLRRFHQSPMIRHSPVTVRPLCIPLYPFL